MLLVDGIVENVGVKVGNVVSATGAEGEWDNAKFCGSVGEMEGKRGFIVGTIEGEAVSLTTGDSVGVMVVGDNVCIVGAEEGDGVIAKVDSSDKLKNHLLKKELKLPSSYARRLFSLISDPK